MEKHGKRGSPMAPRRWFAGICLTAGAGKLVLARVDSTLAEPVWERLSESEVAACLATYGEITVAVAGPLHKGKAAPRAGQASFGRSRPGFTRAAEAELARHGIPVRATPSVAGAAPAWMRASFLLARRLAADGFVEGPGGREEDRWLIETHAAGCMAALLGKLPMPRDTLEGRLQRQLLLFRERLGLADPMSVLEEVTEHHLLAGELKLEGLLAPDELESCAAALTAWAATLRPERVSWLGGDDESWICLPANPLSSKYTSAARAPRRK
jgi:hypothetical protein